MNVLDQLTHFSTIQEKAEDRHGGDTALAANMPALADVKSLADTPDDRWLSEMTKRAFQAGFNWNLIERKWPDFEDAFDRFEPQRRRMMSDEDFVSLLTMLQKRGSRLGGATAQWLLRGMGKDGFVLTRDVTAALILEGYLAKPAHSQRDLQTVQTAFNMWCAQSGLPLAHVSRTLASSVDTAPNENHSAL